jgi:hypothetical protein
MFRPKYIAALIVCTSPQVSIVMADSTGTANPFTQQLDMLGNQCAQPSGLDRLRAFLESSSDEIVFNLCDDRYLRSLEAKAQDYEYINDIIEDGQFRNEMSLKSSYDALLEGPGGTMSGATMIESQSASELTPQRLPTLRGYQTR